MDAKGHPTRIFTRILKRYRAMSFRHALQAYIDNPEHPLVVAYTAEFVTIRDAYPKAVRHFLVLPCDPSVTHVHPLQALKDPILHGKISKVVDQAKDTIVDELVNEGLIDNDELKKAHYKNTFIRAGVHSTPSLANLHIHVITQDFYLPSMKNKRHYNSFTTLFFVDLHTLGQCGASASSSDSNSDTGSDISDDGFHISNSGKLAFRKTTVALRRVSAIPHSSSRSHQTLTNAPLICTYCGSLYGNQFLALKKHLASEFSARFGTHAGESGKAFS